MFLLGLLLAFVGWMLPRRVASTRWQWSPMLLLDAVLPLTLLASVTVLSSRPLFAGVVTLAIGAVYAYADRSKRRVLAEPIVYTDVFQTLDIMRHPELAVPFPHKGRIALGVSAGLSVLFALFIAEPALWQFSLVSLMTLVIVIAGTCFGLAGPLNAWAGKRLRAYSPDEDPVEDAARFGPFATLLLYGILARAERPQRQMAVRAGKLMVIGRGQARPGMPPVVTIQCESFFDIRRLHPQLEFLPLNRFDQCRRTAGHWGRLTVPTWGANTVRTEFAMLSGLPQNELGIDRFNPYHRFALSPVPSLAWRLRAQGYRTICLHPFDRSFYRRHLVLPNLGFDTFIGEEAFTDAQRVNGFVSDVETARVGCEILREESGPVFLFVITMENHGPWTATDAAGVRLIPPTLSVPESERLGLESYMRSLGNADRMLGQFCDQLQDAGVVAFYGDHLPSFPATIEQLGLNDLRSDYLILRTDRLADRVESPRKDMHVGQLGELIFNTLKSDATGLGTPYTAAQA